MSWADTLTVLENKGKYGLAQFDAQMQEKYSIKIKIRGM